MKIFVHKFYYYTYSYTTNLYHKNKSFNKLFDLGMFTFYNNLICLYILYGNFTYLRIYFLLFYENIFVNHLFYIQSKSGVSNPQQTSGP